MTDHGPRHGSPRPRPCRSCGRLGGRSDARGANGDNSEDRSRFLGAARASKIRPPSTGSHSDGRHTTFAPASPPLRSRRRRQHSPGRAPSSRPTERDTRPMRVEARYLDLCGLAEYLSVSRTAVLQMVKVGRLPQPIRLSPRLPRWDRLAVDAALASAGEAGVQSHDEIVRRVADGLAAQGRPTRSQAARRR